MDRIESDSGLSNQQKLHAYHSETRPRFHVVLPRKRKGATPLCRIYSMNSSVCPKQIIYVREVTEVIFWPPKAEYIANARCLVLGLTSNICD